MMLAESPLACRPSIGQRRRKDQPSALAGSPGGTCEACGFSASIGLERHGSVLLCPFCHCTQHLEAASRLKAARLIWLPGTSQANLNAFQVTLFMLLVAPESHIEAIRPIRDDMYRLSEEIYRAGENALESYFSGTDMKEAVEARRGKESGPPPKKVWTPLPATDPYVLSVALKAAGEVAPEKIEGLRLFFAPQPFREHLKAWAPEFFAAYPIEYWTGGAATPAVDDIPSDEPASS